MEKEWKAAELMKQRQGARERKPDNQRFPQRVAADMEQDEQDWIVPEKHNPIFKSGGREVGYDDGCGWVMAHEIYKGEQVYHLR